MPSQSDIDFTIDLVPGIGPIFRTLYVIAPKEMKELKS